MGRAKSIGAFGIYRDYSPNVIEFIRVLSEYLNADFSISTLNLYEIEQEDFILTHEESFETNYNKPKRYSLLISYYDSPFPVYEICFPVKHEIVKEVEFMFHINQVVEISFLTFEHHWDTYIDVLKFKTEHRTERILEHKQLRNEYRAILKKLHIDAVFIFTYQRTLIEYVYDEEDYPFIEFDDLPRLAKELDGLDSFELEPILAAKTASDLDKNFYNAIEDRCIALIDNLNEIKVSGK